MAPKLILDQYDLMSVCDLRFWAEFAEADLEDGKLNSMGLLETLLRFEIAVTRQSLYKFPLSLEHYKNALKTALKEKRSRYCQI